VLACIAERLVHKPETFTDMHQGRAEHMRGMREALTALLGTVRSRPDSSGASIRGADGRSNRLPHHTAADVARSLQYRTLPATQRASGTLGPSARKNPRQQARVVLMVLARPGDRACHNQTLLRRQYACQVTSGRSAADTEAKWDATCRQHAFSVLDETCAKLGIAFLGNNSATGLPSRLPAQPDLAGVVSLRCPHAISTPGF